jgi:hypothetical protein
MIDSVGHRMVRFPGETCHPGGAEQIVLSERSQLPAEPGDHVFLQLER